MAFVIEVAVPRPVFGLYSYACDALLPAGVRVRVPFGKQVLVGVVVSAREVQAQALSALKTVIEVLDTQPLFQDKDWRLMHFVARYYQAPLGMVVHSALPVALRTGASNRAIVERIFYITQAGKDALTGRLGAKQAAVLTFIFEENGGLAKQLRQRFSVSSSWLSQLVSRGWLREEEAGVANPSDIAPAPMLSVAQTQALETILTTQADGVLLEGVTGSGKTEVYLRVIEAKLAEGGQVLVLVPEIGLVSQMVTRLRKRLNAVVVAHHSGLSDRARLSAWQAMRAGKAQVLVGTRSAVFYSFANLAAIVVDEEHDLSFKQQDGLRYQARDVAIARAKFEKILLLAGSATPALESVHRVKTGRWAHALLPKRIVSETLPRVVIEDMTLSRSGYLSDALVAAMRRVVAKKEQVLLFLNRRGFAPVLRCEGCGWVCECEGCDAHLVAHLRDKRMRCHHCGLEKALPRCCEHCGAEALQMIGVGTQRLEQTVRQHFPQARVLRIDSDAYSTASQFEAALQQVAKGEVDILLGTQWLAKGHHLPKVNLVGVIDTDAALFSSDFRSEERLAQLLVQVAGRAGRETAGEVWVQTRVASHPIFSVLSQGYAQMAERIYARREQMGLPPFSAQALLMAWHQDQERALHALRLTQQGTQAEGLGQECLWLGPVPALMARKGFVYRAQLVLQAPDKSSLQKILPRVQQWLLAQAKALGVGAAIDVDPLWLE